MRTIVLAMNLTTVLILAACLQVSASGYSQTVTLSVKDAPLQKVFADIERQTGFYFAYTTEVLQNTPAVTLDVKNVPLGEALDRCLKDRSLTWVITDRVISIKRIPPPDAPAAPAGDPQGARVPRAYIHGHVMDTTGAPLSGASVLVKGRKIITSTNARGDFTLPAYQGEITLHVSYIGYDPIEVNVDGQANFPVIVTLRHNKNPLDKAQVIAYGTSTKRFNVGSVASLSAEDIERQPVPNVLLAMEGQLAGVTVNPTSGSPGAAVRIQVRGQNTLNSVISAEIPVFDQPLFIIDGVPFSAQNNNLNPLYAFGGTSAFNKSAGFSPFNSINPNDIESITVLKDADATSIYGTQGANGVVLITTKRGKPGRDDLEISVTTGINHITRPLQMMNTQQYLAVRHEALKNDGRTLTPADADQYLDLLVFDTAKYTDFFRQLVGKISGYTDGHASLTGGSENTSYIVSGGVTHTDYNFPGDFADNKLTLHAGLHHTRPDKRFVLDFGSDYSYDHNNTSGEPNLITALLLPPNTPDQFDAAGRLVWNYKGHNIDQYQLYSYFKKTNDLETYNLNTTLHAGYRIIPGLTLGANIGYSRLTGSQHRTTPSTASDPQYGINNGADFATNTFSTINIEPQADFQHSIGKGSLTAVAGGTYKKNVTNTSTIRAYGYANDAFLNSTQDATGLNATNSGGIYRYSAGFGRLRYVYDQKYIVSVTGRRDGSSNFGPGRQFGNFGSAGLGWIFSEEAGFKKSLSTISFGKLSGSYGTSGSDAIAPYQFQPFWQPNTYVQPFQGLQPYQPINLYNPLYSWGLKKTLNLSMDIGLLKERILITATWYRSREGNQLTNIPLPSQDGFTTVLSNLEANVQNSGVEFTVSSTNIKTRSFTWTTNFNISANRNKLLSFPGLATSSYAYNYMIGKSVTQIFGYRYKDVNPATGVYEFYTASGKPTYTPDGNPIANGGDVGPIADLAPKFFGGLGNTLTYENFSLTAFFQFSKQTAASYIGGLYTNNIFPGSPNNLPVKIPDHWKNPGDIATLEKFSDDPGSDASNGAFLYGQSSGIYTDASYIRLKTLSVAYNLPANALKRIHLTQGKIYINTQNLLTITPYKIGDPEQPGGLLSFPFQRTIVCGLSLNL